MSAALAKLNADDASFDEALGAVRAWVGHLADTADDAEGAHAGEDQLHRAVLRWITLHGDPASAELAAEALKTNDLDFARWCA